jgi:hypothetical protein
MNAPLTKSLGLLALAGLSCTSAFAAVTPGQYTFVEGSKTETFDSRTVYSVTVSATGAYTAKAVVLTTGRESRLTGVVFESGGKSYLSRTKRGLLWRIDAQNCTGELKGLLDADAELIVPGDSPSFAVMAKNSELTRDPADFWKVFPLKLSALNRLKTASTKAQALIAEDSVAQKAIETAETNQTAAEEALTSLEGDLETAYGNASYDPKTESTYEDLAANLDAAELEAASAQAVLLVTDNSGDTPVETGIDAEIKAANKQIADLKDELAKLGKDASDLDKESYQSEIDELTAELALLTEERKTAVAELDAANKNLTDARAKMNALLTAYEAKFTTWIALPLNEDDPTKPTQEQKDAWKSIVDQYKVDSRGRILLGLDKKPIIDVKGLRTQIADAEKAVQDKVKLVDAAKAAFAKLEEQAAAADSLVDKAEAEAVTWADKWETNNSAVWLTATPVDSFVAVTGSRPDGTTFSYTGPLVEEKADGGDVTQKIVSSLKTADGFIITDLNAALDTTAGVSVLGTDGVFAVEVGVTSLTPSVVDSATKKVALLVEADPETGDAATEPETDVAFSIKNGKIRAYDRASENSTITGSSFVLKNGLLSGTVGARGEDAAYPIYGIFAKFGLEAKPKALISDGKANLLFVKTP